MRKIGGMVIDEASFKVMLKNFDSPHKKSNRNHPNLKSQTEILNINNHIEKSNTDFNKSNSKKK